MTPIHDGQAHRLARRMTRPSAPISSSRTARRGWSNCADRFSLARPLPRTLIDLWHADERGEYDTGGFRYRGHLFTDAEGLTASARSCPRSTPAAPATI